MIPKDIKDLLSSLNSDQEILRALKGIIDDKTLDIDDFIIKFFTYMWDLVGNQYLTFAYHFLNTKNSMRCSSTPLSLSFLRLNMLVSS